MAQLPSTTVPSATRSDDEYGAATHVERINPGTNPAWAPGSKGVVEPMPDDRGPLKPYKFTAKGFHDGRIFRAGQTAMLYADQVGPHHEPVDSLADVAPAIVAPEAGVGQPVKARAARRGKPAAAPSS